MSNTERDPMDVYDDPLPGNEPQWDLDKEDRYRELNRGLWWRPRDRSKQLRRADARLQAAKATLKSVEASHAEAKYKAHRYRWVPFLAGHWKEELRRRQEALDARKAQVKWLELQVEKARARQRKRSEWDAIHAPELALRQQMANDKQQEVLKLGKEKLAELRRNPGAARGVDVPLLTGGRADAAYARQLGERELRRRLDAERAERRREREQRITA